MNQPPLFVESPYDALKAAVAALGGVKAVAGLLFPAKPVDDARTLLLNCLNPDRPEKLDIDQILMILRKAKEAGFHGAFEYLAAETGYARPQPIDPLDERAQLQRDFIAAAETVAKIAARLERNGLSAVGKAA